MSAAPKSSTSRSSAASSSSANDITSRLKRNAKGGLLVDKAELKSAFDFFDSKSKGRITTQDLRSRLSVFYKNLQPREFKFLMNSQPELSFEQLYNMLAENELTNFDPVAEAFKIYDPTDSGYVNMDVLLDIFSHIGFGKLSDDDIRVLVETADVDRDGRISLEDFRRMLDFNKDQTAPTVPRNFDTASSASASMSGTAASARK